MQKLEYQGKGMITLLHLQHTLLFVLSTVVLPGGQAVHTGANVSLPAVVWYGLLHKHTHDFPRRGCLMYKLKDNKLWLIISTEHSHL